MGFSEHISSQTSLDSIQCIQWVEKKTLSRFFSLSNGINASNGGKKKHYPVFFRFPMDSMGFSKHISSQTSLDSIQCIQWVEKKTLSRFFSLSNGINASNGGKKNHYLVFFRFPMDSMGFSEHISRQISLDSIQCIQWVEKKTLSRFFRFP